MKTILTSSVLATLLAISISGCGGSSTTTKKVYLNGADSNTTAHQVGISSRDDGSRDNTSNSSQDMQNSNIERVTLNITSTVVQNIHLYTGNNSDNGYDAISISGTDKDKFVILNYENTDDVFVKNDVADGDYNIIIHAKNSKTDDTIDKELIVKVRGSSIESSIQDPVVTPDPSVSGFTPVIDDRFTYAKALEGCGMTKRLPTYAELENNLDAVKDAVKNVDSDGDSTIMPNIFRSVIWTATNIDGTVDGMLFKWDATTSTTTPEKILDIDTATETYFYTCVPK